VRARLSTFAGDDRVVALTCAHRNMRIDHILVTAAGAHAAEVTTSGTSVFHELALACNSDTKDHASGKAFPGAPGHFDSPNACAL